MSLNSYVPSIKGLWKNYKNRAPIFPFYASFKITSRCQYKCPFCNMNKNRNKDLSTKDIKLILDNLSRSSIIMTSFEGGEPLLRKDIHELLLYARKCNFYLLFTTSQKNILDYPIQEYAKYIDFLHISIDEGHNNLEMFDLLPDLVRLPTQVSVQIVVTNNTIDVLEEKVKYCYKTGANTVIIPASPMTGAENCFPDIDELKEKVISLYTKYPNTIHTPHQYFNAYSAHKCSSASVIIAPDGYLYYPCHILETKGPDLRSTDLNTWLISREAQLLREKMNKCKLNCGWYQYYSIDAYTSPLTIINSLKPMLFQKYNRHKRYNVLNGDK
ncbi:radical SAM protein [bacterium]|nr:radical SAM protein [bacterium]MBU1065582.1 radical SAM protein [bacterium]MBU1633544.1 radical SAM protein [bacterium]MBU1872503.1 radical SAM protein [bacterium]